MSIVKKFTIGVLPFAKMFRITGVGGTATDAVLKLRNKELPEHFFAEVKVNPERTYFVLQNVEEGNYLTMSDDNFVFVKDYYESDSVFSFAKVLEEFKLIYGAANPVLRISDIRRLGIVAESRYSVPDGQASAWLRSKLVTVQSEELTSSFHLRYEERAPANNGLLPDPKKGDFINRIYQFNDSAQDVEHPAPGKADTLLDVQRYFAPMLNGNVTDEVSKLFKVFEATQKKLHARMMAWGAENG